MRTLKGIQTSMKLLVAAILGLIIPACGGDVVGLSISADTQARGQVAAAPVAALDTATRASNDAIVDSGNPGTTSSTSNSTAPSPSSITFQSSVNVMVNLGVMDSMGHPRYPGATGQVQVLANGTLTGSSAAGSATYSVSATATTDIVFTDPDSGDSATLLSGASWTYSLQVNWTFSDANNWTVTAVSDAAVTSLSVTVHHQAEVLTASVSGNRHLSAHYSKAAGVFTGSLTVTADKTVTWSDSTGAHTVDLHVAAVDQITLTVDGSSYGPYTRAQLETIFHLHAE